MHEDTGAMIDKLCDEEKDKKAEEEYLLEQGRETKEVEMIFWKGYEFVTASRKKIYSVCLTSEKAGRLFEGLKEWTGSQRDFYFEYVNPLKLCEDALKPFNKKRETKRIGG